MSLEGTFDKMVRSCTLLNSHLDAFRMTVVVDRHQGRRTPAFVDQLGDRVDDLCGCGFDMRNSALSARSRVTGTKDLDAARDHLVRSQRSLQKLLAAVHDLTGPDVMNEIQRLKKRSEQWKAWFRPIEQSVAAIQADAAACTTAIGECWEELSDRMATNNVSAHATVNGLQIGVRKSEPLRTD